MENKEQNEVLERVEVTETVTDFEPTDKVVKVVIPDTHEVKVDAKSIASITIALVALFNALAPSFGWDIFPFSDEQISVGIFAIIGVGSTIWAWFRNNAVTSYGMKKQAIGNQALGDRKEYKETKKEG